MEDFWVNNNILKLNTSIPVDLSDATFEVIYQNLKALPKHTDIRDDHHTVVTYSLGDGKSVTVESLINDDEDTIVTKISGDIGRTETLVRKIEYSDSEVTTLYYTE